MSSPGISTLTSAVLRIHPEPCQYVDETAVHNVLTADPAEYVAYLEKNLTDIATGRSPDFATGSPADAVLFPEDPITNLEVLNHPAVVIRKGAVV